jgi:hypothetical protein
MTEQSADPELESPPSVFIRFVLPLIVIGCVIVGVVVVVATHRLPPTLSAQELHNTFANQRLSFWHVEERWRAWSDENLDGSGAGFWAHTGAPGDSGRWWLEDDTVCFVEASGTGCWRVAIGPADRIYWYSTAGDYVGTVTMRHLSDTDH